VKALEEGEDFVAEQLARARANRDLVVSILRDVPSLRFEIPQGAFYLFFSLDGMADSTATTKRLIDEAGIGFAPGATFGPAGEGHLRMCFLRDQGKLTEALGRFVDWLKSGIPS
jgi:aspartate/methionine/tyrosine aminotransferase